VILEPNRRRRNRLFRVLAAVAAVVVAISAVAAGWTPPALSNVSPTNSPVAGASPTGDVAVVPTDTPEPSVPVPTLQPTPGPDGCVPPPADLEPAALASHGSRTEKVVALTFDDGNNAANVEKMLGILRSRRVNATFFPTARAVELAPETWLKVAQAGYPIANHTYHHNSLAGMCFERQLAELERAKTVLAEQLIPIQGLMRPPYEDFDKNTRLAARAAGEDYVVLWDVDTFDWTAVGPLTIAARALQGRSGSIILMHTTRPASASALYRIVDRYKARGFRFVTVGQLLGVAGPVPFPEP
jgi:peptidoglycan/xylan/chitin deacetylase (PgdA/CDA1 family)